MPDFVTVCAYPGEKWKQYDFRREQNRHALTRNFFTFFPIASQSKRLVRVRASNWIMTAETSSPWRFGCARRWKAVI